MSTRRRILVQQFVLLVILGSTAMVAAQEAAGPAHSRSAPLADGAGTAQPPMVPITFSEQRAFFGTIPSATAFLPFLCTSDGTLLVAQMVPPSYAVRIVASSALKPGESVVIDQGKVPGFQDVHFIAFSANSSEIVVYAEGNKFGDRMENFGRFLLVFDRDGAFQRSIRLDVAFDPMRFGVLPSGNFLMTEFDRANNLPKLVMLDSEGMVIRYLDLKIQVRTQSHEDLETSLKQENLDDTAKMLSTEAFVPFGDDLLLVPYHSDLPVLEIGDSGIVRSTRINVAKDEVLNGVLPSDTAHWIADVTRKNASNATHRSFLAEIDQNNGKILRRFEGNASVVCAVHDVMIGIRTDSSDKKQPRMMLVTGTY